MHLDPILPLILEMLLLTIGISIVVRNFKQPAPLAYILSGILLGTTTINGIGEIESIGRLGSFGIIFLLFYAGQEISVKQITQNWKLAVIGTYTQIIVSVLVILLIGHFADWSWQQSILIGFAVGISSTAMAINILEDKEQLDSLVGRNVITFLISQDLAIVPMMIILGLIAPMASENLRVNPWWQLLGGALLISTVIFAKSNNKLFHTILNFTKKDKELQFLVPIFFCLLFAFITGYFEISTALGAFVAGLVFPALGHKDWFHQGTEPFKVVLVGLFFISVGLMVDVEYLKSHFFLVALITIVSFTMNTIINTLIFRSFRMSWGESLYAGALLSQLGEFGFILASIGLQTKLIDQNTYQLILIVTAFTLFLTPIWSNVILRFFHLFQKTKDTQQ